MAASDEVQRAVDNLRILLPGVLDGALKLAILEAVDEFCRRTDVWLEAKAVTTTAGTLAYVITPATEHARFLRLLSCTTQDRTPLAAYMDNNRVMYLTSDPGAASLIATFSLIPATADDTPSDLFPELPAWFWETYAPAIMDGVAARLMRQPAKPYANARAAEHHAARFTTAVSVARNATRRGSLFAGQRWSFPAF